MSPRIRMAATGSVAAFVLASCVPWETDLPPDLAARVNGATGTIAPRRLVTSADSKPESLEEGRQRILERIDKGRAEKAKIQAERQKVRREREEALEAKRLGPDGLEGTEDDVELTEEEKAPLPEPEPPEAPPPVGRPFPLADVRLLVLQRNLDLNVIAFDPEIAAQRLGAEQAKFDATLFAGARYEDQNLSKGKTAPFDISSPDPLLNGNEAFLTEAETNRELLELELGAKVPLPTGGELKFGQVFREDDKDTSFGTSTEDRSKLKFTLSQNLLRNAGIAVNTASIRVADYQRRAIEAKTKLSAIRILANAEKSYWKLWGARAVLAIREEQFELAIDNLAFIQRRIDNDLSPSIERAAVDFAVASQLQKLFDAQIDVRLSERSVRVAINEESLTPSAPEESFLPQTDPQLLRFELDPEILVEQALQNRMELLELELKLAADAVKIEFADNQTLPVFAFDFGYELSQRGATLTSAFADSFDRDNQTLSFGLRAEIPATNRKALAKFAEALAQRGRTLATRASRVQKIRKETLDSLDSLNFGWNLVLIARQGVIAATANYDAERRKLEQGLSSAQDLLIALQLLGDARGKEVKAIVGYQLAQIDLAFATGTLLGYAGTELDVLKVPGNR